MPRPSDSGSLKRPIEPMPADVRQAIDGRGLMAAYDARPPYQRNDYLRWLRQAKRGETREKRLNQMLNELERGSVYMNMRWNGAGTRDS